jgi:hypothetical protein
VWLGIRLRSGAIDELGLTSAAMLAAMTSQHPGGFPVLEVVAADDQPAPLAPAGTGAGAAASAHVAAGAAAAASGAAAGAAGGASGSGGGGSEPAKRERDEDAAAQPARAAPGSARRSGRAAPQRADTHGAAGPSSAAAPASSDGHFTIRRTGESKYLTCAALEAALQPGDRVLLHGVMHGPLLIRFEGVRLHKVCAAGDVSGSVQPELIAVEQRPGAKKPVHTLTISADDVRVGYIRVRTPRETDGREQAAAVLVTKNVADFFMFHCSILGHGRDLVSKSPDGSVNYGHTGVWLETGVRNAFLEHVTFANISGDALEAHRGCTGRLNNVRIKSIAGLGVNLRGTGKFVFDRVHVEICGINGFRIFAFDVCTLRKCCAQECGEAGLVVTARSDDDELDGEARHDGAAQMHDARGMILQNNATFGALCVGGAAVDLSGAVIDDNGWNGVRVALPAPPAGATARTLLAGALLRRNGLASHADHSQAEHAAIAFEPKMLPWIDTTGVNMEDNGVDECVEVSAAAAGAD